MAILPVGIGSAEAGGYQIERSLRFNSADSANLTRTPSTNGNRKTWTWSAWIKRSLVTQAGTFWGSNFASGGFGMAFGNYGGAGVAAEKIGITLYAVGTVTTNAVFRDPSAWYHIVARFDSTQASQADRFRLYVNGVLQTLSANLNVTQNADYHINEASRLHVIGGESGYFNNFYMAEIHHVDGQSLTPDSFGETDTDTGVWKPKAYSGSYGTNGFYLNFSDNSGTTSTTLGKDYSGNGNNWTPNNFSVTAGAGNDSLVDTPTNYGTDTGAGGEVRGNYATLNSAFGAVNGAINSPTNGNLNIAHTGGNQNFSPCTIPVSSGKWYFEATLTGGGSSTVGIWKMPMVYGTLFYQNINFRYFSDDGKIYNQSGATGTTYNTYTVNDTVGVALDMDSGKVFFSKNGVWQGSSDPAAGTNPAASGITDTWAFGAQAGSISGSVYATNFGQRPFAYTAPSGFKALCTQNLPEPTIVKGGEYFNTVLWTGTGATNAITDVGFAPDWVWIKSRSTANSHRLFDIVRGATKTLSSNATSAETTESDSLTAFNSNGFTLGADTVGGGVNVSGRSYVGWNWKANGAGSTNTAGSITSTVSVNTTAGFSIVTWTGNGIAGATTGHGLGVAPAMIIMKDRGLARVWIVYHRSLGNTAGIYLNLTQVADIGFSQFWNNTSPTTSVFSTASFTNENGSSYVAYCFAPVAGYSAFGSYTGNGSTDGPFVYTGFRPRFILYKTASVVGSWAMLDTSRTTSNVTDKYLLSNTSDAEGTFSTVDILSNGFKVRNSDPSNNPSGSTVIYAAFAENPFKYSLAR